ncbi:MAG: phage holin family protein [Chloroflexota bacterium]
MDLIRRMVAFYRLQFRILWNWRPGRRALIRRGILSFVVAFIALTVTIWLLPGLSSANYSTIAVAVLILGVLNMAIRPLLLGLLAGISVVAVGVATLVFQVAAFLIVAALVPDFHVNNVLSAFIGSLVYGVINTILTAILAIDEDESYWAAVVQQLAASREGVVRTDKPGLVIVQIDGLAQPILAHQIRAGRVPFISHWLRSGAMKLDTWTALLPSQTSASQAGILHGNNSFIPAFRWWEKSRGRMLVSNHPEDAAEIVKRASDGEGLLSNDGASVGNLVSGDAVRSYVTMATIKDKTQGLGKSQTYLNFFASPYNYLHTIVRTVGEVVKEYVQARRSVRAGVEPSMHRGMPYPVARAATNVTLRDMSTSLVMEEMYRGTPVIYVDYTDYDEIAHHSGPERGETLDALDGVDRTVKSLVKAAEGAPRPYRFLLLSDHGQSLGATFRQRYGKTLQEVISELMGGATVIAATAPADTWGPLSAAATEASQTGGTTGAVTRAALRSRSVDGVVDLSPEMTISKETGKELPDLVVCASGNLALIYFPRVSGRVTFEEMEQRWPGMVAALSAHPGIGLLMVRSGSQGTLLIGPEGARRLEGDADPATDPVAKYGPLAILGLRRVDAMEHCGDLVVISLLDPATDEVAAFEELIGSHGGLGGPQTQPFILHPADWPIDEPIVGAENVYRQIRRWMGTIGIDLTKPATAATTTSPPDEPVAEALTPAV